MAEERLQKVLAAAGVASRRASEKLIVAGRVRVDGRIVTELGTRVDPKQVQISVDGRPITQEKHHHIYYKVYKPRGYLSDMGGDSQGRSNVADLLPPGTGRVFPVGRLDLLSEGLVLLTDDGDLAYKLTHPRFEHPKTYYVLVSSRPGEGALAKLRNGVDLPDGRTAPAQVQAVATLPKGMKLAPGPAAGVWLEVVLHEGKKRQIRHMTAAVGFPTLRLLRWSIGTLTMADLKPSEAKPLTRRDIGALRHMVTGQKSAKKGKGR